MSTSQLNTPSGTKTLGKFDLLAYLQIARPDHWFKNIFVIPGIILGFFFYPHQLEVFSFGDIILSLIATCLIASSNYVLNEILDAPSDLHHPLKHARPIPSGRVSLPIAYLEWLVLAAIGFYISFSFSVYLGSACLALWIMGIVYNVPPLRTKDVPYLDVLSESVNNPLRLAIGWYATGLGSIPPLSVILAYWMFGAYLMAVKRFAEFRTIGDPALAGQYRSSFKFYDEKRLLISIIFYVSLFAMFAAVFLTRYRLELLLAAPITAYALAYYLELGFRKHSPVEHPEGLYKEPLLMFIVALNVLVVAVLFFVDIPIIQDLIHPWHLPPHPPH
ncbi:MAG: UbiA prenyltransferase family protein [bacterium]|nr:UbiA prenyltransferase family protein [bacterium]